MDSFTPNPEATTEELMIVGIPTWSHDRQRCYCAKDFHTGRAGAMSNGCAIRRAEAVAVQSARLTALRKYVAKLSKTSV